MKAQIIKVSSKPSKRTGGTIHLILFKCDDGKTRRTWIDTEYLNYPRWKNFLRSGVVLDNLGISTADNNVINADSYPREIKEISTTPKDTQVSQETQDKAVSEYYQDKLVDIEALPKERQWY